MRGFGGWFRALLLLLFCILAMAAPANAAQLDKMLDEARKTIVSDPTKGLALLAEAEAEAGKLPEGRERMLAIGAARRLRSEAYLRQNRSAEARPLIDSALKMIEAIREPVKLRGDLLVSRGALEMLEGQAAAALSSYQNAFAIYGQLGEKRSQAITLQNIASLYTSANDDARAEAYYRQAAETYDGDPTLSLSLHNNRGNVLLSLKRYTEAAREYAEALELARSLDNGLLEARVLVNVARTQIETGQLDAAQASLNRGFALTGDAKAESLRRQLLVTAARVAAARKQYPKAAALMRQAFAGIDIADTSIEFRNAHMYAHEIFEAVGEPRLALAHLESLKRLNDETAQAAMSTGAALMAARFDSTNQKLQIANLKAEELRRSAEFQRTIFIGAGGATLVLVGLLSFGLVTIRRSRNQVRAANVVLGETNTALEKALKAKTEFLATTSHEIRTPLNGILGMTQVMLRDPKLDAETRDRIGIVHGAGTTMRSLVDDILDLAKMETGNLTVDAAPMDLCGTLKEVTRLWEEQARAKGLGFQLHLTHAPRWIVSDAGRLRQIVFNLLANAIKFTESGAVSLRAVEEGEGDARRLKLAITDSGIGIPADKLEEIFESFKQADSGTTRKFGGTGLGLTICRNLAEALGGQITVESVEGEGSTFTVDLPLVPAEAPAVEGKQGSGTVVLLERNPITRSMLKTMIEPHVATLKIVATPDEAKAALAEDGADWLVADEMTLKAAGEDVFATVADVTAAAASAGAKVAILWAKPDEAARAALATANASQVLEKPVTGASLIDALVTVPEENSDRRGAGPLVSHAA
jgi:signal transduction histidine kinase